MLLNKICEIVLRIVVLLDVLKETAVVLLIRFFNTFHGKFEDVLTGFLIVNFYFFEEILWQTDRALVCEEDDCQYLEKLYSSFSKDLKGLA